MNTTKPTPQISSRHCIGCGQLNGSEFCDCEYTYIAENMAANRGACAPHEAIAMCRAAGVPANEAGEMIAAMQNTYSGKAAFEYLERMIKQRTNGATK